MVDTETIQDILPMTERICQGLANRRVMYITLPMLAYHLWVYIYLGYLAGGTYFYTGCMYVFNYAGTCVAYWIVYRQSQNSYIHDMSNIIWHNEVFNMVEGSHKQLLNHNLLTLRDYPERCTTFKRYCRCWECLMRTIFTFWWGVTLVNVVLNILQDLDVSHFYTSFDDHPLGLYGYYNLSGQFIAALAIMTASVTMLTGFFQLKCMIRGFAYHLREYRQTDVTSVDMGILSTELRERYLSIQGSCLAYSELWSVPIMIGLTFCTQVLVSSIFVIHYSVQACIEQHECEPVIVFPFVWLFAAIFIMGIILNSIAKVNGASQLIKDAFIYSGGDDYLSIGGRRDWLEYIESNRLEFPVCGMVITTTLVVNVGYTVATAVGGFLASNIFG